MKVWEHKAEKMFLWSSSAGNKHTHTHLTASNFECALNSGNSSWTEQRFSSSRRLVYRGRSLKWGTPLATNSGVAACAAERDAEQEH